MRSNSGQLRMNSLVLLFGAESHDAFHAGTVVPAAIEQHHFTGGREMRDIALEVPLGFSRSVGVPSATTRQMRGFRLCGNALDHATFAGRVAAFENADDFETLLLDPFLQLDQLDLQLGQFFVVFLVGNFLFLLRFDDRCLFSHNFVFSPVCDLSK